MALEIRKPVVAGIFYPFEKDKLKKMLNSFFKDLDISNFNPNGIKAIIAPHAGYIYSGKTAAYSYKIIEKMKPDIIVVIGPSHREVIDGSSVYCGDVFQTPLGDIKIAKEICKKISSEKENIFYSKKGHNLEHSIEVQLPFLQYLYKSNFKLVPIVVGDYRLEHTAILAKRLMDVLSIYSNVLFVVSSDMSHYKSSSIAEKMDRNFFEILKNANRKELFDAFNNGDVEACGIGPVLTIMEYLKTYKFNLLKYSNSGEITGECDRVVGYGAGIFYENN